MKYLSIILAALTICGCATKPHTAYHVNNEKEVMFAMLGYISEYGSRFMYRDPDDGSIERFYPGEKKEAFRFEQLMMQYSKLHGQSYDVVKDVGSQGHISFKGQWISEQINKHYVPAPEPYERAFTVNQQYVLNGNSEQISAYIESALDRNGFKGEKNVISLANATFKSETIAKALIRIGSEWSTIYVSKDLIPTSYWIHFSKPAGFSHIKEVSVHDLGLNPDFFEWKSFKKDAQPENSHVPVKRAEID